MIQPQPTTVVDDDEILARLRAGDQTACQACIAAHSDGLYRLALRLLRDEAAAEDVVQETFVNAWKALDRFDGRSRLGTWLFRIAYNAALMRLRAQKPVEPLPDEADEDQPHLPRNVVAWTETPEEVAERRETAALLDRAIDALPETLRTVFVLRDIEERSTAETAEILGLTEAAVKVRLHRARMALRERLADHLGAPAAPAAPTMTCEQLVQYLSDYIDRELDEPLAEVARAHIAECDHCHVLLDTTRDTLTLVRAGSKQVIPGASRTRLFREIGKNFAERKCF